MKDIEKGRDTRLICNDNNFPHDIIPGLIQIKYLVKFVTYSGRENGGEFCNFSIE